MNNAFGIASMKRRTLTALALALLLGLSMGSGSSWVLAQALSADAAAGIAAQATGGRVLGVQLNGAVYVVRVLLPNGVVRDVNIDANSGAVR